MKNFLIAATLLYAGTLGVCSEYRPYIATRMAKAVMQSTDTVPDEDEKAICDGSGFITHGDGHRTPCPGCSACGKGSVSVLVEEPIVEEVVAVVPADIMIYYFGADWCSPCVRLGRETWGNPEVAQFLKDNRIQLVKWDYDNLEHREHFRYYGVTSFPTVHIIGTQDRKTRHFLRGFFSKNTILPVLRDELQR